MPATSLTLHRRCVADIWPGCSAPTLNPGLAMDEIEQDLRGLRPAFVASQVHLAAVVVFRIFLGDDKLITYYA